MEDYEKKYKEALERAKKLGTSEMPLDPKRSVGEQIFPELAESKNERVRKAILELVKQSSHILNPMNQKSMIAWLEKQSEPIDKGEISDGYHTFNELYHYRMLYNAAFFNMLPKEWVYKSKKHHDGEECFGGGWFIVMAQLPTGQVSNHYELKDWDLFQIPEKETADEWDGHTPQEAADRLHKYLIETQGEQNPVVDFKAKDWYISKVDGTLRTYIDIDRTKFTEQKPTDKIQIGKKYKCIASPRYSPFMIGRVYKPEDKFLCSLMNFCSYCFEPIEDEQNPAWSEEDEKMIDSIIDCLDGLCFIDSDQLKWLKSIKQRMKGE